MELPEFQDSELFKDLFWLNTLPARNTFIAICFPVTTDHTRAIHGADIILMLLIKRFTVTTMFAFFAGGTCQYKNAH
jgi:hypothetical protein